MFLKLVFTVIPPDFSDPTFSYCDMFDEQNEAQHFSQVNQTCSCFCFHRNVSDRFLLQEPKHTRSVSGMKIP